MKRSGRAAAFLALLIAAAWAVPARTVQAPVGQGRGRGGGRGPRTRKVVLAWADTRNGIAQHDSVSHALAVIERLGYESGAYDTYIRTDSNIISRHPLMTDGTPASGGPSLNSVDAIFFLGHREIQLDAAQKADLLSFVKDDGKGFVGIHAALDTNYKWPEYGEMIGGWFDQHPWSTFNAPIINEDPNFPAVRHFPAAFNKNDEIYQAKEWSREKVHVLLSLDPTKLDYSNNPRVHRKDHDFAVAWDKMYGKGRVFYSTLGHTEESWSDPDIRKMYFEAIRWVLGMTDGSTASHPRPQTSGNDH